MSVAVWVVIFLAILAAGAWNVLDNEKRANRGPGHQSTRRITTQTATLIAHTPAR